MADKTVDYGIDLGTTNSAIARMRRKGPEIAKNRDHRDTTPSAVAVDGEGVVRVGTPALTPDPPPAQRFKLLMGSQNVISMADGSEWSSQQLSAEVLKDLRASAKRRFNEDIHEVVITVPAMFNQAQCAATHEAAELAGLDAVVLMQEPIAAATAFLSEEPKEGYYLVYDLGGGTFDVSLIQLRDGEMNVVEHGGNNHLGGSEFDRLVFDWVLDQVERQGGDISQFEIKRNRYLLLRACEEARKDLTEESSTSVLLDDFEVPVLKVQLTREILEALIEPLVAETIALARDRLSRRGLDAAEVNSILLVGGPTQTPYIKSRLESELGIELNCEQDPMTVVALGAAIHAGSLRTRSASVPGEVAVGKAVLRLIYDPVCPEDGTTVAGTVIRPAGFKGEVRLLRSGGDWETGWKALVNSAFSAEVRLGRQQVTEYTIELRDIAGTPVECEPKCFEIRSGVRPAQPLAPYNYGVVLEDGKSISTIVRAGTPLPAEGANYELRLSKPLLAGSPDEGKIYFVECLSDSGDDAVRVGELTIKGADLKRTLREKERIEVRIRVDESRLVKAKVHIPLLDLDYDMPLRRWSDSPDYDDLAGALMEARVAISGVEDFIEEDEQDTVIRASRKVEDLENILDRVEKGEVGEAEHIHEVLQQTKASIRPLLDKYELGARHARLVARIEAAEELCREFNDKMGIAKLGDARKDADRCLQLKQGKALTGVEERARDIFWQHYGKKRECWEYQIEWMREAAPSASDTYTYYELVRRAEDALSKGDYEGVRMQAVRAYDFLPSREKMRNRFYDSVITR